MSDTTYVDYSPPLVNAAWLNDVNNVNYRVLGSAGIVPNTVAQLLSNIGVYSKTDSDASATAIATSVAASTTQSGSVSYAIDTGTASTIVVALSPAPAALTPGMVIRVKVAASNTGATTINVNGLGAIPVSGLAGSALQGGELIAGSIASFIVAADASSVVLQNYNAYGITGQTRNAKMSVTAASATATFTADEIVVAPNLGGFRHVLANYSQTINLATTGVGGMDTGTAPASGYVALYAIYNSTAGTASILAVNATSVVAPEVYGGASMPAGYTASALVSVWPTNASGQLIIGTQQERRITFESTQAWESNLTVTNSQISLAGVVPLNAKRVSGYLQASTSASTAQIVSLQINADASLLGAQYTYLSSTGASASLGNFQISLKTPQIAYVTSGYSGPGATLTYIVSLSSYEI